MELGLKGKVALVTASSKGIGLGTAKVLAGEGMKVAISSRDATALKKASDQIAAATGQEVLAVTADMTVREDLERLVETTSKKLGGVDVLVYNTGPPKPGTFGELTYADWEEATKLLLLSAVTLTHAVVPHMKSERWGRLIYITSLTLKQPVGNLVLSNTVRLGIAGALKVALEGARSSWDNLQRDNPGLRQDGPHAAPRRREGLQGRYYRGGGVQGDGEERPSWEVRRARRGRLPRSLCR